MCSQSDRTTSRSPLHAAATFPSWSHARRVQLVEYVALSLALHAALGLWASVNSPSSVERAPDEATQTEAITFSISSILLRPEIEEPIQVASLAEEAPPPPVAFDRTEETPEPVSIAPSLPPAELPPAESPPPPQPPAPPRGETPDQSLLSAASPPPADEPIPDEPAPDSQATLATVDEPPPALEATPAEPQPTELGTPEGADQAPPEEPAPELHDPVEVAAASAPEPASEPKSAETDGSAPGETELDLPAPRPGPGPGDAPPAIAPSTSARAAEPPPRAEPPPAKKAEGRTFEACRQDAALMAQARSELAEGSRKGLTTVLLAAPEDQLEIARFFGEELVLVPKTTLDASAAPRYFRLADAGSRGVETVPSAPPLEGHRQYRDLFDYEYARLPAALRDLRRSVPAREDVFLFAALLSPPEWALVIARRQEALARAGRDLSSVRQFVLRYAREPRGGFDLRVVEIVFSDGSRVRSGEPEQGVR